MTPSTSLADALARTSADARLFWQTHLITPAILDAYAASASDPHRDWVLEEVAALVAGAAASGFAPPAASVLEVGCHCGPLLARLTDAGYDVSGIDASPDAVSLARGFGFRAEVGSVPNWLLGRVRHYDVVVSSWCLAYVSPPDLPQALAALLRTARVGLVLAEPMAGPGVDQSVGINGPYVEWKHDYLDALDVAMRAYRPAGLARVDSTRTARGPFAGVNGTVVARCVWRG